MFSLSDPRSTPPRKLLICFSLGDPQSTVYMLWLQTTEKFHDYATSIEAKMHDSDTVQLENLTVNCQSRDCNPSASCSQPSSV